MDIDWPASPPLGLAIVAEVAMCRRSDASLPQKVRTVRRQLPAIALVLIVGIPALVLAGLYLTFDLSLAQEVRQLLEVR